MCSKLPFYEEDEDPEDFHKTENIIDRCPVCKKDVCRWCHYDKRAPWILVDGLIGEKDRIVHNECAQECIRAKVIH
jgi:hypothetical protein